LTRAKRPRRALESAKGRLMVVIDPARKAFEIQRLESRLHGLAALVGAA
jgi:predicted metalloprotease